MPITPFLAGQAFDPEAIENMSAAFVAACDALRLKVGDEPATRFVAEKVIEFAQRGVRDPNMLWKLTVNEFGLSDGIHPQPATISAAPK
jgi:hypothetical protein